MEHIPLFTVAFVLITGVIVFSIVDAVTTDSQTPGSTINESVGLANASGYLIENLGNPWVLSMGSVHCNGSTTTNYTVTKSTGAIVINGADCINDSVKASYKYDSEGYISGSLSRTIITYLVPLGLLALIGVAAYRKIES